MDSFYDQIIPEGKKRTGKYTIELPVLYFRDDAFILVFSADEERVRQDIPSDTLEPIRLRGGRCAIGFGVFNYIDTTIGPYGELGIVVPVVHGRKPGRILPLLRETRYPGFGHLVLHLPVTNLKARDGGRVQWGYAKFTSDMRFLITPEFMECRLSEGKKHILTVRVGRRGFLRHDDRPLITYTVKDGSLLKTVIPQKGIFRECIRPKESFLELGNHQIAEQLRSYNLSPKPLISRYALERAAILPSGEEVEKQVQPLDGYRGSEREGSLKVLYRE